MTVDTNDAFRIDDNLVLVTTGRGTDVVCAHGATALAKHADGGLGGLPISDGVAWLAGPGVVEDSSFHVHGPIVCRQHFRPGTG